MGQLVIVHESVHCAEVPSRDALAHEGRAAAVLLPSLQGKGHQSMLWGQWREPAEGGLPLTCSHDILVGDDVAQALRTVLLDPRAGHRRDCTVALSGVRLGRPPLDLYLHGVLHFRFPREFARPRL